MKLKISNHPDHSTIERYAELVELLYTPKSTSFSITLEITHILDEIEMVELTKTIVCKADNSVNIIVDQQGNTMGDYDVFSYRFESGDAMDEMVEDGINLVDTNGTINTKMNYQS